MPVDPQHQYTDTAHVSTIDTGKPYKCHNRAPVQPFVTQFQDGWTFDGKRNMVPWIVNFKHGVDCGHVGLNSLNKYNDPKCSGCRWQGEKK